ncbi:MAG TPA: polysaccharide biosynthesis tyrosine autokinase [Terracidiphilus sp.]|nr:polysaccharide biosynthesis tyrosine autokinase [Terracidiphilus sp.]
MSSWPRLPDRTASDQLLSWAAPPYYAGAPIDERVQTGTPAVPLSHYFWILRRHLWKILAFVAVCVLATFVVSSRLHPIYESTAIVNVDRQAPSEVVGAGSNQPAVQTDEEEFLATQIRLIQSDSVLRPVAEQFHLLAADGKVGHSPTAQEQLRAAAPVSLSALKVTRPPNTLLLLISYRSANAQHAADIANAIAKSYLFQTYDLRIRSSADLSSFMERQLDALKAKMERSSLALAQFEKNLDVVNPEEKTNILSARLLQLNNDYTTAQSDRIRAEAVWDAIKSGPLGTAAALSGSGELAKLNDNLNQAQQQFALVKSTYGATHPEYRKAASELAEVEKEVDETRARIASQAQEQYQESLNREKLLQSAVAQSKADWDQVNARSFQYQQLKQEADADRALYDELITKIREANINEGFQNNNIRIADYARPSVNPVFPNIRHNLVLAFLYSLLLAIGAVILWDRLDTTLRDPKEASRFLQTDVIATMPIDKVAVQLPRPKFSAASSQFVFSNGAKEKGNGSYYGSSSSFDEAVRTLRNTILLSDFESRLHSIALTSATPSEGKTTVAVHLAIAHADHGKKTLLVDGDLRRPSLHSKFGLSPNEGLANVLTGELSWHDAVIPIEGTANLSLLPAGLGSHRAADLIGPRLAMLLDEFGKEYDMVILDSPPLLGFAESLQMASAADGVLIVSRAADTKRRLVAEVIATLRRVHANIIGVVLNCVSHNTSAYGYSYYGYDYGKYSYRDNEKAEMPLHPLTK